MQTTRQVHVIGEPQLYFSVLHESQLSRPLVANCPAANPDAKAVDTAIAQASTMPLARMIRETQMREAGKDIS